MAVRSKCQTRMIKAALLLPGCWLPTTVTSPHNPPFSPLQSHYRHTHTHTHTHTHNHTTPTHTHTYRIANPCHQGTQLSSNTHTHTHKHIYTPTQTHTLI